MVAAAIGGGSAVAGLAGSAMSSSASQSAAAQQAAAANQAAQNQMQEYQQTRADLLPYNTAGQAALGNAQGLANQYQGAGLGADSNYGMSAAQGSFQNQGSQLSAAQDDYGAARSQYDAASGNLTYAGQALGQANGATGQQIGTLGSAVSELSPANATIGNALGSFGQQSATTAQAGNALSQASNDASAARSGNALLSGGISQQTLENTPSYQFTLQQGLESTQNGAAARGLGSSGAAQKAAASYATGLADQTYMNQANIINEGVQNNNALASTALNTAAGQLSQASQYGATGINQLAGANQYATTANSLANAAAGYGSASSGYTNQAIADQNQASTQVGIGNAYGNAGAGLTNVANSYGNQAANQLAWNSQYQGNLQNAYGRQSGLAQLGENAGATTGQQGVDATNAAGQFSTGAANALASGQIGSANALTGGLNSISGAANQYQQYQMYNQLLNPGSAVTSSSSAGTVIPGLGFIPSISNG